MNERIKELAIQAEKWIRTTNFEGMPEDEMTYDEIFQKKFAELVVQECLLKVNGAKIRNESYAELVERIKEDFGVEE